MWYISATIGFVMKRIETEVKHCCFESYRERSETIGFEMNHVELSIKRVFGVESYRNCSQTFSFALNHI